MSHAPTLLSHDMMLHAITGEWSQQDPGSSLPESISREGAKCQHDEHEKPLQDHESCNQSAEWRRVGGAQALVSSDLSSQCRRGAACKPDLCVCMPAKVPKYQVEY